MCGADSVVKISISDFNEKHHICKNQLRQIPKRWINRVTAKIYPEKLFFHVVPMKSFDFFLIFRKISIDIKDKQN